MKWTYILYITLFKVSLVTYGVAPLMAILIIKRAIYGLGGSGIYVSAMALLAIITTIYKRLIYLRGTSLT
jgi:MFS family permease